jgi:2-dehydropantoate 2-reductase
MESYNICIVGPGALGIFLACRLSQQHNVWLLAKDKHLDALQDRDLKVAGAAEQVVPAGEIKIITEDEIHKLPNDVSYWLCVKAYDLDQSVHMLRRVLTPATPLLFLSNGLGIFLQIAMSIGRRIPMVRVCANFGVKKLSAVEVELAGAVHFSLSSLKEHEEAKRNVNNILAKIAESIICEKDVATAEWNKALINLVVNSICTVADSHNAVIAENSNLRSLALQVLEEIHLVAEADGFDLPNCSEEAFFSAIEPHHSNINSTLADLRSGRRTETEYLLGRFLRIAEDNNVEVPVCLTLYNILKFREEKF